MANERTVGEAQSAPAAAAAAAVVRRSRWPGWIWAIPITAAGILIWFGARFMFTHGETVTVIFEQAAGVSAQNTKVQYRGVQVGEVKDVALTDDGMHVRVRLSMNRSADRYLRSGTRFWLQSAAGDLSDLSSLMSLLGGPSIEMEPGTGRPQRQFVALAQAPAFKTPTAGTRFTLTASSQGSATRGSSIYYLGLNVGKVTDVQLVGPHAFRYEVLVRAPYDRLVHANSRFYDAGALELSMSSGLKLQLLSPLALLQGAVAFETPDSAGDAPPSPTGSAFKLYGDKHSADLAPQGPEAYFAVDFPDPVGGLAAGAPVKLLGFVVGHVEDVGLQFDPASGQLRTPVTLAIDADRLRFSTESPAATASGGTPGELPGPAAVTRLKGAIAQLVRRGLRARLAQDPPLVGADFVSLDLVAHAPRAQLDLKQPLPQLPAANGGGLKGLTTQLGTLPLQQIGANVRSITDRIRSFVNSPQLAQSLAHVQDTLSGIDQMVRQVKPQIPMLIASLRRAADQLEGVAGAAHQAMGGADEQGGLNEAMAELTRTARSVRALADYLQRHPEALLRGKQP
ncbi:MAG TPA: MlaD family protein [Steroidobacteraceae bacterium]|jgi:paraquat-inducible protein B|nr:MlaD family protein [Steroidobacteraceae bacterium]